MYYVIIFNSTQYVYKQLLIKNLYIILLKGTYVDIC